MTWSSTAIPPDHSGRYPHLVSDECVEGLVDLMQDNVTLAIATEASSHPSGLDSLFGQPWLYAGGGLGNYKECPLQYCLAGASSKQAFTFASVCLPESCTAYDVDAPDYLPQLERATQLSNKPILASDYFMLQASIRELNHVLKTGWTCGIFVVPWNIPWTTLYVMIVATFCLLAILGTYKNNKKRRVIIETTAVTVTNKQEVCYSIGDDSDEEEKKENSIDHHQGFNDENGNHPPPSLEQQHPIHSEPCSFWKAWNVCSAYSALSKRRCNNDTTTNNTACLDGLRVGSILWIILGHVMAIQSSVGAGYNNPSDFLPPNGLTTTLGGQLLFASRFAVDTFLLLSGYLTVRVLLKKLNMPSRRPLRKIWFLSRYFQTIPALLCHRILRIMPLYGMTLGFWILVAPHLGGGPFWYQWLALLQPCAEYGWTNWLFVNNFIPTNLANTETCFYHSWYLAIDVQLFIIAPLLVYWYQQSPRAGKRATAVLTIMSVSITVFLSYTRRWSINTFDGAAVARFDVEGYAKPHVRAQSYLSGMLLAMCLDSATRRRRRTSWRHVLSMASALTALAIITFGTVTGAYSQRPCRYEEWPLHDDCGSTWSPQATFWYTATARAVWSLSIAVLLGLCLSGHGGLVGRMLSCKVWTPLSQLTFGAYLVHPIVIFVWQLSDTQKVQFSLVSFGMNYIAVVVVSFGFALVLWLLVEYPCSSLQKHYLGGQKQFMPPKKEEEEQPWKSENDTEGLVSNQSSSLSDESVELYGSFAREEGKSGKPTDRSSMP